MRCNLITLGATLVLVSGSLLGCGGGSSGAGGGQASVVISGSFAGTGIVGSAYSSTLTPRGGTAPYTWTVTGLPDGVTVQGTPTATLTVVGIPTTAKTFAVSATATDATGESAAVHASIVIATAPAIACVTRGNEASLMPSTPYAFVLKASDGGSKAGSFTPNGDGTIQSGEFDHNAFTGSDPEHLQVVPSSSSYGFGSDGRGCLTLAFSGPPSKITFSFVLGAKNTSGVYLSGRIIEFDDTTGAATNASGMIHAQDPSSFTLSSLKANYAFGLSGSQPRFAIAGIFANTAGVLSPGFVDISRGEFGSRQLIGGSGAISSTFSANGRATGTLTISQQGGEPLKLNFALYILNASDFYIISSDNLNFETNPDGILLSGRALATEPSFGPSPLNGNYLLASMGFDSDSGRNYVQIGALQAGNADTTPAITIHKNDGGAYSTTQFNNGTYQVTSGGRVSFAGLGPNAPVVYLTSGGDAGEAIEGFTVSTDGFTSSGVLVKQGTATPNFSAADLTGEYAGGTEEDPKNIGGAVASAYVFDGAGHYAATVDASKSGAPLIGNEMSTGVYTTDPDGSGFLDGYVFIYLTNGSQVFAMTERGNNEDPELLILCRSALVQ
jgi:hypothetical protein